MYFESDEENRRNESIKKMIKKENKYLDGKAWVVAIHTWIRIRIYTRGVCGCRGQPSYFSSTLLAFCKAFPYRQTPRTYPTSEG